MNGRPERPERGAATVLVLAFAGVLVLVGAACAVVAALLLAHRTAQAAADLAALAAAQALAEGGDACGQAGSVARRHGAELVDCRPAGAEVRLTVVVEGPRWLGQTGDGVAEARAGPQP
ncbi:Rv3654c family TadE-like protein [Nocardioides nanhaiensis]|uniref:Putative Flp pilus-assembly TadG-like N-terminal domain-containing protein n=1 Tax=Nocardioides nanhaiensis TaxID=1476871 RepID=A0ABP8VSA9_9ACTN